MPHAGSESLNPLSEREGRMGHGDDPQRHLRLYIWLCREKHIQKLWLRKSELRPGKVPGRQVALASQGSGKGL